MKELWRRTLELIRRYPVLWVPVLWAGALSYGWGQLRWILLEDVLPLLLRSSQQRSVLGGMVTGVSQRATVFVQVLGGLATYFCQYAQICCYVFALMMTAKILRNVLSGQGHDNPYADLSIGRQRGGVLLLGFLIWVVGGAMGVLFFLAVTTHANSVYTSMLFARPYLVGVVSFATCAVPAYLFTPMALRLLSVRIKSEQIARGRKASLLAAVAFAGLAAIQNSVPETHAEGLSRLVAIGILRILIFSLPYVPLLVALCLVAVEPEEGPGAGGPLEGARRPEAEAVPSV
jgi:hypothetical protein